MGGMQVEEELLHPGHPAPDFTLPGSDGQSHTLSTYRGQWVLLYFYPKDDTWGCTEEACSLRDYYGEFKRLNASIFGVSADSIANHQRFAEKYHLPFVLLSDAHQRVATQYDAVVRKQTLLESRGIARVSFLIDIMGEIERVYRDIKPKTHARQVLGDIMRIEKGEE